MVGKRNFIENEFIENNVAVKVYIGLSDVNSEGNPEWVNGEALSYSNFDAANDGVSDSQDLFETLE